MQTYNIATHLVALFSISSLYGVNADELVRVHGSVEQVLIDYGCAE